MVAETVTKLDCQTTKTFRRPGLSLSIDEHDSCSLKIKTKQNSRGGDNGNDEEEDATYDETDTDGSSGGSTMSLPNAHDNHDDSADENDDTQAAAVTSLSALHVIKEKRKTECGEEEDDDDKDLSEIDEDEHASACSEEDEGENDFAVEGVDLSPSNQAAEDRFSVSNSLIFFQQQTRRHSNLKAFQHRDILTRNSKSVWVQLPPVAGLKDNFLKQSQLKQQQKEREMQKTKHLNHSVSMPVTQEESEVASHTHDLVSNRKKRSVQFDRVHIRSFDQTVGDNPSVSYGPPISLDWTYEDLESCSLNDFEAYHPKRRNIRQMMLSCHYRRSILFHRFGCTEEQLNRAEKIVKKLQTQRSLTRAFLPVQILEEGIQSAARKWKRLNNSKM